MIILYQEFLGGTINCSASILFCRNGQIISFMEINPLDLVVFFTEFGSKVWNCCMYDDGYYLHELNMKSLVWTKMKLVDSVKPAYRYEHTFTAINVDTFVSHGGYSVETGFALGDIWLLDLPSATWSKYTGPTDHGRADHTATKGINKNIIIFGGCSSYTVLPAGTKEDLCNDVYIIKLEPDSLLTITSKVVCRHRAMLQSHWKHLPRTLQAQLNQMCQTDDVI